MSEYESPMDADDFRPTPYTMRGSDRLARKLVLGRLARLAYGSLRIYDGYGFQGFAGTEKGSELSATIRVTDGRFYTNLALGGAVGAAEAYMLGYWHSDDLTGLIRLLAVNRNVLENLDSGLARLANPLRKALHWINRNTKSGSRRNISAHYDLGNEFFSLWLDDSMMYSAAVFDRPDMSLEEASAAKLDRICQKLELTAEDQVLEIGTGWGGFAIHAATHYGCRVTTTTISREQYDFARARVTQAGLDDRITLLLKDYRDLEGEFDKVVSIEMIEAVGHEYLDTYFSCCSQRLKPGGMMALQAITIPEQRYQTALKSVDFIQRYIFPGGFLPSVTAMLQSIGARTDMRLYHLEDIGEHYATTLRHWRERFHKKLTDIRGMGYSEEFLRMWEYYYCYCEGAFLERAIGNVQMLLVKPESRRTPIVPRLARE
ncbi:MAG: cyclopropane-fatty-acyl-phospholipid synthase family protein [Gammaproteobacteria bacterium]|nr:cyclopropane-fatty-acyl-phospholipid synthase family protein [Gammaproteobacteria bacterium]